MLSENVVIIGAGLAGLNCAKTLQAKGVAFEIYEARDRIGGRVTSDVQDGFTLDRGFQVILDSYPEAQKALDFAALKHRGFSPGALVRQNGAFWRVVDPWRSLGQGILSLKAPFMTLKDGIKMASLRKACLKQNQVKDDSRTTAKFLQEYGFSEAVLDGFFRPFFRGVTLDPKLEIPASYFRSLFGWFAQGSAGLPEAGIKAIPAQLSSQFPEGSIHLGQSVQSISGKAVTLHSQEKIEGRALVIATDFENAHGLLEEPSTRGWLGATTLYFSAPKSPIGEAILVLNGEAERSGPVNHLCALSDAQPTYAPSGQALIAATIIGIPKETDEQLVESVLEQMRDWYGEQIEAWQVLRVDRIREALPRTNTDHTAKELVEGVFRCGDYLTSPSIQGAMGSGRDCAEALCTWLNA